MTTYIAGPMTGLPEFNHPAFAAAAEALRAAGITVISPHETDGGSTHQSWEWYVREDLKQLLECDEIVMLPGWQKSRGARLERHIAEQLGMRVIEWSPALCRRHTGGQA